MATQKKIVEMLASIKTIYPYYAKEAASVETLVKTWGLLLKNYDDQIVEAAFLKCLQTCKMPPTPADVIEQIETIAAAAGATDEELWDAYTEAMRDVRKYYYRLQYPLYGENPREKLNETWDKLPGEIKQYIGSMNELIRMSNTITDNDLQYEKSRFLKAIPTMKKRAEYTQIAMMIESPDKQPAALIQG